LDEEFGEVQDLEVEAFAAGAHGELEVAAGVGGEDGVDVDFADLLHLAVEDGVAHLALDEVVDAGAAAAVVGVGEGDDLEFGDRREDLPGWLTMPWA
jgi:hypothetical protein